MGTPELSAVVFKALLESEHEIVGVVTQPDRPKGRKGELAMSPVKQLALEHNIPVFQPERCKEEDFLMSIKDLAPDLIAVAAFGQLLPEALLNIPRLGCINVHTSLLPKYRGASPIQWAVLNGEEKTGVTIMYMAKGLDTGDIIEQCEVVLDRKETTETLTEKLSNEGGRLLVETIKKLSDGTASRRVQDDSEATYVKVIEKSFGEIDFEKSAVVIERMIRGLDPWPTAYTFVQGKTLKLWNADVVSDLGALPCEVSQYEALPAGSVAAVTKTGLYIKTGDGALKVNELQLEGKKRMMTADFLRGFKLGVGDRFGR